MAYMHDAGGWHWATGDLGLSLKYRFYHDQSGLQLAVFPAITLPTAGDGLGAGRVTALLPVWAQKDWGPWSVFGGGGYAINPGLGNRDYWTGGIAVSRQLTERWLVGAEMQHDGPDTVGGNAATRLGVAAIYDLPGAPRLMASGGPTFEHGGSTGFHVFAAFNLVF
jgi:hypothetical protein